MMQPPPALGGRPGSRGRIDKKDLEQLREAPVSLRRIGALFAPHRWKITLVVALIIASSVISLATPFLVRAVIDDAIPHQNVSLLLWAVGGHRGLERASCEAELGERDDVRLRLCHEIRARDAEIDDAVLRVLGDVARSDEQEVDGSVRAGDDERPLGHLERQTGIRAEAQRRLRHAALRGHGEGETAVLTRAYERRRHDRLRRRRLRSRAMP